MFKLGPVLAEAYVMITNGNLIWDLQTKMYSELKVGIFNTLDILHHITTGMKSIYTQMAYDAADLIRQNWGGAGYSAHSMLP